MSKKNTKETVELFTEDMHREMFLFQPAISSKGWGGSKPVAKAISIKVDKKFGSLKK